MISDKYEYAPAFYTETWSGSNFNNDGTETYGTNHRTPLSVFSGTYCYVGQYLKEHTNATEYPSQWQASVSGRCWIYQRFSGEIPISPAAEGVLQVTANRSANSVNLIDEQSAGFTYLGEEDDIYMQTPQHCFDTANIRLDEYVDFSGTYSLLPDSSLNSLEDIDIDEDGFIPLSHFYLSSYEGNPRDDGKGYVYDVETGDTPQQELPFTFGHRDVSNTYFDAITRSLYYIQDRPIELILMPDSRKIYDWFKEAVDADIVNGNLSSSNSVGDWVSYVTNPELTGQAVGLHTFGLPVANAATAREGLHGNNYYFNRGEGEHSTHDHGAMDVWAHGDELWHQGYDIAGGSTWGFSGLDLTFPNILFQVGSDYYDSYETQGRGNYFGSYVTFGTDAVDRALMSGQNIPDGLPQDDSHPPSYIDFWDLVEFKGLSFEDFPRFRIDGVQSEDDFEHNYTTYWTNKIHYFNKSLDVKWNGVSINFWENSGEWGGYPGTESGGWGHPPAGINEVRDCAPWYEDSLNSGYHPTWNEITSNVRNWCMYYTEDYTDELNGMIFPKGTIIHVANNLLLPNNNQWGSNFSHNPGGKEMIPGDLINTNPNYVQLQKGVELEDDVRIGLNFTLEDINVDDVVDGSGITTFFGMIALKADAELTGDSSNVYLYANWFPVDTELDDDQYSDDEESYEDGVMRSLAFSSFQPNFTEDYGAFVNSMQSSLGVSPQELWHVPDNFNAGAIRFLVKDTGNTGEQASISLKTHHIGVRHSFEISNVFDKDFYLGTYGRPLALGSTNAVSVIHDLIINELEIDLGDEEDVIANINEAHSYLVSKNYNLAFSINKKINSKKLIEDIGKNSPAIPLFKSDGNLSFSFIKDTYDDGSVNKVVMAKDVIKSSFTRTKIEKVKTICRVKHKKDYARDSYGEITEYKDVYDLFGNGDAGFLGGYKKTLYGLDPTNPGDSVIDFESDYIRSHHSAKSMRNFLLAYNCNQHSIIKVKLPLTYVDLEISDIVRFDSLINDLKCYGENYTVPNTRNGQEIYPYFMVTSVNKSIKSVDIECLQMHNLTADEEFAIGGTGDVNRNGIVDYDAHNELVEYIAGNRPYFTAGQLKTSDMTGDSIVNDSDASLLLELIDGDE